MTETLEERVAPKLPLGGVRRCSDCDEDCWEVKNKLRCWLGNENTDIADGYCPWLMEGLEFPPRPEAHNQERVWGRLK